MKVRALSDLARLKEERGGKAQLVSPILTFG